MIDGALIVQGGGTRGAFAAGALDVLMEEGLYFSDVYGTSAGALCSANYLSGDHGRSRYVVTELMRDKRFVSVRNYLLTKNLFNFKYLFRVVPKKKSPFNEAAFRDNPIRFYSVCTCLETGEVAYIPKTGDMKKNYAAMAASASLPFYARPVKIDGKRYLDGGQVAPFPYHQALERGIEKVVIILTREKGFVQPELKESTVKKTMRKYGKHKAFAHTYIQGPAVFNADREEVEALEEQGRVFVIRPDIPPTVGIAESNKEKLDELYRQGREACMRRLAALRVYLGGHE